jgi:GT2 family glycosyltransferase
LPLPDAPEVSIVVPSGRGAESAAQCVRLARAAATGVDHEIVVAADGPRWPDPVPETVEGARVVRNRRTRGPSGARNTGILAATAPLIAMIDDDVRPRDGWLRSLLDSMTQDLTGVGGPVVAHQPRTVLGRFADWRKPLDASLSDDRYHQYLVTANCLYRRDALVEVGLFDETFRWPGGEDVELSTRLIKAGHRLGWAPAAIVEHEFDVGWKAWIRTHYNYGRGTALADAISGRPQSRWRLVRGYGAKALRWNPFKTPFVFAVLDRVGDVAQFVGEWRHAGRRP